MKINIGTADRALRTLFGSTLVALAVTDAVGWWGWLGIVPWIIGATGFCPLYALLGFKTCPVASCRPGK